MTIDPARSALLSMDMQAGVASAYVKDPEMLARAASVLARTRAAGMAVIHVKVGFRPGLPEVSGRNRLLGAIKDSARHQQFFEGASGAIHGAVAPQGADLVVSKSRVNAFVGTDLELILRAREIDTLVMFGMATSGVVLATLLHAADADYRIVVVKDCCADLDPELHGCLIERFFPKLAAVMTAAELLAAVAAA